MDFKIKTTEAFGKKITVTDAGKEVARATLYVLKNDLHKEPFGFIEDVFVDESLRGQGVGTKLAREIIEEAKRHGCYKIIATSRHIRENVHRFYEKLGFTNYGLEFRIDL
ncbi:MAG: GNAT family N-acetyltransferase [Patescibacteria group bacterium]